MGFVNNDQFIICKEPIGLRFGQQYAIGHQLDIGVIAGLVIESDFETDILAEGRLELAGNPAGYTASSNSPRLGVTNVSADTDSQLQSDQRKLRRLTTSRFATDHDDLMIVNGVSDFVTAKGNRQAAIKAGVWKFKFPLFSLAGGSFNFGNEARELLLTERLIGMQFAHLLTETKAITLHAASDLNVQTVQCVTI